MSWLLFIDTNILLDFYRREGSSAVEVGKVSFIYDERLAKGVLKITFPSYGDSYRQGGIKRDCWQMIRTYLLQSLSEDQIIEN